MRSPETLDLNPLLFWQFGVWRTGFQFHGIKDLCNHLANNNLRYSLLHYQYSATPPKRSSDVTGALSGVADVGQDETKGKPPEMEASLIDSRAVRIWRKVAFSLRQLLLSIPSSLLRRVVRSVRSRFIKFLSALKEVICNSNFVINSLRTG